MFIVLTLWVGAYIVQIEVPPPYRCGPIAVELVSRGYAQAAACSVTLPKEENGE